MEEENGVQNNNLDNNKSHQKHIVIIILVLLLLALVFGFVYYNYIKKDDKPKNNSIDEKNTQIPATPVPTITPTPDNNKTLELAGKYIQKDDQNCSYYYNDGYVIKYSEDGKVIKKGNIKINDNFSKGYVVEDNMYLIIDIDNTAYLYDFMNDTKYEIMNLIEYGYCQIDDEMCIDSLSSVLKNIVRIDMYPRDNKKNKIKTFVYDITSKKISLRKEINLAGKTFKSKDGKNTLKIVSLDDSEALKQAKKYNVDMEDLDADFNIFTFNYFGYYNNTFFLIYYDAEDNFNLEDSKYMVLGGTKEGNFPQNRDTHSFVINKENNTLVDFNKKFGDNVVLHQVGNNYYFAVGGCGGGCFSNAIYNEQLKIIGEEYYGNDSNNNIYVLNNEIITKYGPNGEIVKTNSKKYNLQNLSYTHVIINDTIYFLLLENEKVYLFNGLTDEKYELGSKDNISFSSYYDFPGAELREKDGVIIIEPSLYIEGNYKFTFNPSTKELKKN